MNSRCSALLVSLCASAALADVVSVSVSQGTPQRQPEVRVAIREPILGFRLSLKRGDGRVFEFKGGGPAGVVRAIPLEHPEGNAEWSGSLVVNLPDGSSSELPMQFETQWVRTPLALSPILPSDLDLSRRRLTLRISRPAAKVELGVLMDTGRMAFQGDVTFKGEPAGSPLTVSWPEAEGAVMRLSVKAWDTSGYNAFTDLYPWSVNIPHDEVNFDRGKADLRPEEKPKLDQAFTRIVEAVEKYGDFAKLRLYVLGHTDSVGGSSANLALSLTRARAMAGYFTRRGLRVPVFYEGFGEEALAVPTADETDEPKNRRAEYIVSIAEPRVTGGNVQARWKRL
jgi:outer membrane protein OmpA-like peptidoglycan-associated protein